MANLFSPFGFKRVAGTGYTPTFEQVEGQVNAATANIFFGDPVFRLVADGTLAGITTGPGPGATPIAGIFIGCKYLSVAQKRVVWGNYWPGSDVAAGTTLTAYIENDPAAQFVAQVGVSTVTGFALNQIGLNAQFAYGTGNAANGISGAFLDQTVAPATTATFPFRILGLITSPPGSPGTTIGPNNYVQVAFNNVETKNTLGV